MDSGLGLEISTLATPILSSTMLNISIASTPSLQTVLTPSPVPHDPTRIFEKLSRRGGRIHKPAHDALGCNSAGNEIAAYLAVYAVSVRMSFSYVNGSNFRQELVILLLLVKELVYLINATIYCSSCAQNIYSLTSATLVFLELVQLSFCLYDGESLSTETRLWLCF